MESHSKMAAIVITAVLSLVVGGGIGWWIADMNCQNEHGHDHDHATSMMSNDSNKAASLRSTLVGFGVEHMDLTYSAVASTLNGTKSAKADAADLYKNGTDLGAAVGSVYGKDAEKTFNSVWKLHLDEFVNYAVAASKDDTAAKKKALSNIDSMYTKPLAAYLAKANPNLPEDALYSGLKSHVDMTAVMIDNEAKGDYAAATKLRDEGATHLTSLFSTLADGIVKQFPDKF
ncbi:MAG TPA: hypothetical protein PL051_01275 [Candidatus Saccharibacteria bacterium]|nr:hypothetical protein [Candidatus Saccharibacteria bacterium]